MSLKKWSLLTFIIFILTVAVGIVVLNSFFHERKLRSPFGLRGAELWSHRGYLGSGALENSLESIQAAKTLGFQGVEIDVYFDGEKSEFIVSHDLPYKKQKNGKLLNLKAVFEKFENLKFWLDLKNLNSSNQKKIIQRLNQLNQQFKIKGRILIESQNGRILRHLALEGYHSVFWILVNQKRKRYWLNELERRLLILMTPFAGVSMDYKQLMGPIGEMYRHLPIFTFTVNEKEDFEKLKAYQPRVVLTDKTNTWGK